MNTLSPTPKCKNCKYFIKRSKDILICNKFKNRTKQNFDDKNYNPDPIDLTYYVDTESCRKNVTLCGPSAIYFVPK
jgi:hypothetical protein